MFPQTANALNSTTMQARQTCQYATANQSNLPFKRDAAAGILADFTQLDNEDNSQIFDWVQTEQQTWNGNPTKFAETVFERIPWNLTIIVIITMLVDEIQILLVSLILHTLSRQAKPVKHRIGARIWPTKWGHQFARLCMAFFVISCAIQCGDVDFRQMPFLSARPEQSREKRWKSRQKPDMFRYISGCRTFLWAPSQPVKLQQKCTLGDGNCWWRAIAHGLPQKWYTIKRRVLKHAAQNMTLDDCQQASVKAMLKPNAWADEVAAHATAHYLQRTIVVVSGQQIIVIKPDSVRNHGGCPIIVGHERNHFSFVHTQQAQQILKQHVHKVPRTFKDYRASDLHGDNCSYIARNTVRSIKLRWRPVKSRNNHSADQILQQLAGPHGHVPGDALCENARKYQQEKWWTEVEILQRGVHNRCLTLPWCKISNLFFGSSIELKSCLWTSMQGYALDEQICCRSNYKPRIQVAQQISPHLLFLQATSILCAIGHFCLACLASCQVCNNASTSPLTLAVREPKQAPSQPRITSTSPTDDNSCETDWVVRFDEDHGSRHRHRCGSLWEHLKRFPCGCRFWGGAFPSLCILACCELVCTNTHAVAASQQSVPVCMQDIYNANCSFGPSSNKATTCPSINNFWEFDFRKFGQGQPGGKGTTACSCVSSIFKHEQHAALCSCPGRLNNDVFHKFRSFHLANFGECRLLVGNQMALAEQVRRVAQGENQTLPRAWRGRARPAGNLVPRILQRPAAKARVSQPVPSRSPDLDLAEAVRDEPVEVPDSPEPVEIVELLENHPGTQEQQVQLVSIGLRWRDNQAVQVLGHLVVCNLQDIEDPGRDRALQGHLGYHPDTVSRLIANMEFMQPFFDALYEALQHRQSTVRFTCTSGRHRSVAAVHLAKHVLRGIVSYSNISIQHASRGHWGGLCNMQCAECYDFVNHPPAPYLRAVATIREDLLQALRGYMHRCSPCMPIPQHTCPPCPQRATCAGAFSNSSTSPSTCAVGKIKPGKNVQETNFAFLQHKFQQFSAQHLKFCTSQTCSGFGPGPFLFLDRSFKGCSILKFFPEQEPSSLIVHKLTCPPRRFKSDQPSSWVTLLQSSCHLCCQKKAKYPHNGRCTYPLRTVFRLSQDPLSQCILVHSCCCTLQPRRTTVGNAVANTSGRKHGNYGVSPGIREGLGSPKFSLRGVACPFVGIEGSQFLAPCRMTVAEAVSEYASTNVNVCGLLVLLKVQSLVEDSQLGPLQITIPDMGNFLGSKSIFCNQDNAHPTSQCNLFASKFNSTALWHQSCICHFGKQQEFQQSSNFLAGLCLWWSLAMTTERLSEALQRVAQAKTSPLLPKAFVASKGGPIVPKILALRCPPKLSPEGPPLTSGDDSEEPPKAKPKLAPPSVVPKTSNRMWPPPTPPRASRPSSAYPAASAPSPAASPKPSAAPPVMPPTLHLEEGEGLNAGPSTGTTADAASTPASRAPMPVSSPKPSAAPPAVPTAINLEEDEAPQDGAAAIVVPDEPEYNILIISEGIRFRNNRTFPFEGHEVWCDLRDVENPERDRRLQAHLGYHPLNIRNLMVNEVFMRKLFEAMREALVNRVSKIRFVCHSGRHRSVAATHLAHLILAGIVGNDKIAVRHASSGHWHNICQLQCDQCWNFVHNPPAEFHRALDEIRQDLLQSCQAYMTAACSAYVAASLVRSWGTFPQCTFDLAPKLHDQACMTGDRRRDGAGLASGGRSIGTNTDRQHQYIFLFLKNLQTEQFSHNTPTQAIDECTNFSEQHLEQLPQKVPGFTSHKQEWEASPANVLLLMMIQVDHTIEMLLAHNLTLALVMEAVLDTFAANSYVICSVNPLLFNLLPSDPVGKEQQRNRLSAVDGPGAKHQHSGADAGLQILSTLLIVEQVQLLGGHSGSDVSLLRDQSPFSSTPPHIENHNPIQGSQEDGILHDDPIQAFDDDDLCDGYQPSCPPTVLDGSTSQSSHNSGCNFMPTDGHLPSSSRKRSAQQAFADDISQELHIALLYEQAPSSHYCHDSGISTNEVASLQQCLYDGYNFADGCQQIPLALEGSEQPSSPLNGQVNNVIMGYLNEANLEFHNFGYPDSPDVLDIWDIDEEGGFMLAVQPNQVLLRVPHTNFGNGPDNLRERVWDEWTINSHGDFVFCACSQQTADTVPFEVEFPSQNRVQPDECDWADQLFWDEWEQDSDGHLHQRSLPSRRNRDFLSRRHDEEESMWDMDPYELLSSEHYTSAIMSEPSTHPSLRDLQMLQWATPESHQVASSRFQGGGKDSGKDDVFQPTSKDVGRMVQKLKHVPHGLQNKQVRMLLTSNLTLMKKIERTTDAQHLLSCITAAAQRVGMQMNQAQVDPPGKGKSSKGKGKNLSSEPSSSSNRQTVVLDLPLQTAKDKGKGEGLPNNAKDKGKGRGQDAGAGKQHSFTTSDPAKSKGKGKTKTKLESPPQGKTSNFHGTCS